MADGPARVLGIYGGTCFLVYIETSGFTKAYSPVLFGLPLAALSFLSLTSSMQAKPRFVTAAAFGVLALSRYMLASKTSYEYLAIGYMLVAVGNLIYFYSFMDLIEEWSIALSVLGTMYYCTLAYYCFADLFSSIPFLVFIHACAFASSCFLVVAAGSAFQDSSYYPDEVTVQPPSRTTGPDTTCSNMAKGPVGSERQLDLGDLRSPTRHRGLEISALIMFHAYIHLTPDKIPFVYSTVQLEAYNYEVASYMRLIGTLANVTSNTMFLLSLFGSRVETLQILSRCIFYFAQGLMFLANERTYL